MDKTDRLLPISQRVDVAALALGRSPQTVWWWINRTPELVRLYGRDGPSSGGNVKPTPPTAGEIIKRKPSDIPERSGVGEKTAGELLQLVSEAENEMHFQALEALEVHERTVAKLRRLDGLASSTGSFIAIGLEKTHRMYYLSLVNLLTVADQIKERYIDKDGAVPVEILPFYLRNYLECTKEFGNGYKKMIDGAAVILKVIANDDDLPGDRTKPKYTGRRLRPVTPINPANGTGGT